MGRVSDWVKTHKRHAAALIAALLAAICLAVAGVSCSTTALTPQPAQEAEGGTSEPGRTESPEPNEEPEAGNVEAKTEAGDQSESAAPSTEPGNSAAEPPATSKSEIPAESGGGTSGNQASTHTHAWRDHTATRQVWVSNMVTVPDYETRTIYGAQLYTQHSDGQWYSDGAVYWFENGFTSSDLAAIIKEKMKTEGYIGNYVNRTKTEQVQVGSHQEDQGWYEMESYVDYQYCGCGARK